MPKQKKDPNDLLDYAIRKEDDAKFEEAIRNGANIDGVDPVDNMPPIKAAALTGNLYYVRYLLERNAIVTEKILLSLLDSRDRHINYPHHYTKPITKNFLLLNFIIIQELLNRYLSTVTTKYEAKDVVIKAKEMLTQEQKDNYAEYLVDP